jgi:hypothetical protein
LFWGEQPPFIPSVWGAVIFLDHEIGCARLAIPLPTEWERIGNQTRPIKLLRARAPVWREFIVRADEKLTAFLELDSAIRVAGLAIATRHKDANWCADGSGWQAGFYKKSKDSASHRAGFPAVPQWKAKQTKKTTQKNNYENNSANNYNKEPNEN